MSLNKILEELGSNSRKISEFCAYQALYDSLSAEDKKALDAAWAKGMPTSIIVRALRQDGHKTSNDAIRTHRRGECRCPKK